MHSPEYGLPLLVHYSKGCAHLRGLWVPGYPGTRYPGTYYSRMHTFELLKLANYL